MKVDIKSGPIEHVETGTLVVPFFKGVENTTAGFAKLDSLFNGSLSHAVHDDEDFFENGRMFTVLSLAKVHAKRIVLAAVGNPKDITPEKLRLFAAKMVTTLQNYSEKDFTFVSPGYALHTLAPEDIYYALTEGSVLASHQCDEYKTQAKDKNKKPREVFFYLDEQEDHLVIGKAMERAALICTQVNAVKDLANGPANIVTPSYLAQVAKKIAKQGGMKLRVLDESSLRAEGMNCILAVARGSAQKPAFIVLEYKGARGKQPLVLVGKGVTFDSGGIHLKPSGFIETMKEDMTGAAIVMQTMSLVAQLRLPLNLVCVIPAVENMPDGNAFRPGDIVTAANGKTVEIANTDAEGRLILADALHYATRYKPAGIIDFATLTGAALVALGMNVTPIMGTDPAMVDQFIQAGKETYERCWELPLYEEYSEAIKGELADLKNLGGPKGEAGVIAGAVFLKEFVGGYPWLHLDIGGTSWNFGGDMGYMQKGSTGTGVRLLVRYLENLALEGKEKKE